MNTVDQGIASTAGQPHDANLLRTWKDFAGRALVARALGWSGDELALGPLSMTKEPSSGASPRPTPTTYEKTAYHLAWVALPWMLVELHDRGSIGTHAAYSLDELLYPNAIGGEVRDLAGDVYPDERRRDRFVEEAWQETFAFLAREWPTVEALAARFVGSAIPANEVPVLPWPGSVAWNHAIKVGGRA